MPYKKPGGRSRVASRSLSRLRVEYNLEKEPLRTGRRLPLFSWRASFAAAVDQWVVHRRTASWLVILAATITLTIGFAVGRLLEPLFAPGS